VSRRAYVWPRRPSSVLFTRLLRFAALHDRISSARTRSVAVARSNSALSRAVLFAAARAAFAALNVCWRTLPARPRLNLAKRLRPRGTAGFSPSPAAWSFTHCRLPSPVWGRPLPSEGGGHTFESCRARHSSPLKGCRRSSLSYASMNVASSGFRPFHSGRLRSTALVRTAWTQHSRWQMVERQS